MAWRESSDGRRLESMLIALAKCIKTVIGDVWRNCYRFDDAEAVVE